VRPTVTVLNASWKIAGAVASAYPPAYFVFSAIGVLLSAVYTVTHSQEILVDAFGRIENVFVRLAIYAQVPLSGE